MSEAPGVIEAVQSAARLAAGAVAAVAPAAFGAPTPCPDYDLRTLLDHLAWDALLARRAATRTPLERDGSSPGLPPFLVGVRIESWGDVIGRELVTAADAWADPAAWEGQTVIGTTPMDAGVVGPMILAEFVLHGWDVAQASGAAYDVSPAVGAHTLAAVEGLASMGRESGRFGPEVPVPADAPAFDRALALSGRSPGWSAP